MPDRDEALRQAEAALGMNPPPAVQPENPLATDPVLREAQDELRRRGAPTPVLPLPPDQPAPVKVPGATVRPKAWLDAQPDPFEKANTELLRTSGLALPPIKNSAYDKWAREYQLELERDPAFSEVMQRLTLDPDEKVRSGARDQLDRAMRVMYTLTQNLHLPNVDERRAALKDGIADWFQSPLVNEGGHTVRPPQDLGELGPVVQDQLVDLYNAYLAHKTLENKAGSRLSWMTSEERKLANLVDADQLFAYLQKHQDYYLGRYRLERATGQPIDRNVQRRIGETQWKSRWEEIMDDSQGGAAFADPFTAGMLPPALNHPDPTNTPTTAHFPLEYLSGIMPDLTRQILAPVAEVRAARQQAQIQAQQAGVNQLAALPIGGALRALAQPDQAAAVALAGSRTPAGWRTLPDGTREYVDPRFPGTWAPSDALTTHELPPTADEITAERVNVAGQVASGALNLLTLGLFEGAVKGVQAFGAAGSDILTGNPSAYKVALESLPAGLWKALMSGFDPKGAGRLAQYDAFWREAFPVSDKWLDLEHSQARLSAMRYTELALERASKYSKPNAEQQLVVAGAADEPLTRAALAGLVGSFVEDGTGLMMMLLGSHTFWRATHGVKNLIPIEKVRPYLLGRPRNRWTALESWLSQTGQFTPVPAADRAPLVEPLLKELNRISDPNVARRVLDRLREEVAQRGPLDPELSAGAWQALMDAETELRRFQGSKLTPAGRRALADLVDPIYELGPTDALYVVRGEHEFIAPRESARYAATKSAYLEFLDQAARAGAPLADLQVPRSLDQWLRSPNMARSTLKMCEALVERAQRITETGNRRSVILQVLDDLRPQLAAEHQFAQTYMDTLRDRRVRAVTSHYDVYSEAYRVWKELETQGGWVERPNKALYQKIYQNLQDLTHGGLYTMDTFVADKPAFSTVLGAEADALRAAYKSKNLMDRVAARNQISRTVDRWLTENSRPDMQRIPPNPSPRAQFMQAFEEKLQKHGPGTPDYYSLMDVTPAELEILNSYRTTKLRNTSPGILRAMDRDITTQADLIKQAADFRTELEAFYKQVDAVDPLKPMTLKTFPAFVKELEARLGSPAWLLRNKRYAEITPGMTPEGLSGLETWQRAVSRLTKESAELSLGLRKFSALDMAAYSVTNPKKVIYMLHETARIARDLENGYRWSSSRIQNLLNKKLTPAEMQQLLLDMREGKPSPKTEWAYKLWQHQRMMWLMDAYRSGRITATELQKFMAPDYYHGVFDRSELKNLPEYQIRRPAAYNDLRVSPWEFDFKIPEDSWYVAYREGAGIQHRAGFADSDAAAAWIQRELKPGTECAIHPPWTFTEKEAHGLIVEAGTSMLDLSARMGLNNANALIGRTVADSPWAMQASVAERTLDGRGFDAHNKRWFKVDDVRAGPLHGMFVHQDVINWLVKTNASYGWYKTLAEVLSEQKFTWNQLLTPSENLAWRIFGKDVSTGAWHTTMRILGNTLGMGKVALNPFAYGVQLMSNLLFNLPAYGLNPFTPHGFMLLSKYFYEGVRSAMKAPTVGKNDLAWQHLHYNGALPANPISFHELQVKTIERNWNSVQGLETRVSRLQNDLLNTTDPKIQTKILEALDRTRLELDAKLQKQAKTFLGQMFQGFTQNILPEILGAFTGKSKLSEVLFNSIGIFDTLSKYAAIRYGVEHGGLTWAQAAERVNFFMQNLHKVPEPVAALSNKLGGSKFTTYPFNMAQVFGNTIKYRPLWFAQYLGKITAWNYAMLSAQGKSPDEEAHAYAAYSGYGSRNGVSDLLYFAGRIHLPNGYQLSMEPAFGWFYPRSLFAKTVDEQLVTSDMPAPLKAFSEAGLGFASKFAFGSVALNLYQQFVTQRDYRGNPMRDWKDHLGAFLSNITPDYTPYLGRDWKEVEAWAGTNYINPSTGDQKNLQDYFARRLFQILPPDTLNSHARFKAALMVSMAGDPTKWNAHQAVQAYDETLRSYLWSKGRLSESGQIVWDDATRKLVQDWLALPDNQQFYLHGKVLRTYTPEEITQRFEAASMPSQLAAFKDGLTLNRKFETYAYWRTFDPTPEQPFLGQVEKILTDAIDSSSPSDSTIKEMLPLVQGMMQDPRLPEDARARLRGWHEQAVAKWKPKQ